MVKKQPSLLSPRRIAITGGIRWSEMAVCFCRVLGEILVARDAIVVTRGGKVSPRTKRAKKSIRPVDEYVVKAAAEAAVELGKPTDEVIETLIGDVYDDRELFYIGTITPIRGRTYEAQRFSFVNHVDGVIGIGGRGGTEQTLVLGLATERPILPVTAFGGASAAVWKEHESDLVQSLSLQNEELNILTQMPADEKEAIALAEQVVDRLLGAMTKRCFIITPFENSYTALYDFVISPAVEGLGDKPIRLDRMAKPGDVGEQIENGIRQADYVIVVLDGMRSNVLYELGLAHGIGKPTVLMNQRGNLGTEAEKVPFDLAQQQRLEYDSVDRELPKRLQKAIRAIEIR